MTARAISLLLSVALAGLAVTPAAQASNASAQGRPQGVSAGAWAPITKNLGFVIEQPMPERDHEQAAAALGYFVVKRGHHWLRLDAIPHGTLFRGPLTASQPVTSSVWITKNLRFVVQHSVTEQGNAQIPAVLGYFVLDRHDHSLRLDSTPRGALFRGPLTASRRGSPWVPITADFGFTIETPMPERDNDAIPSVLGHFVVNQGGRRLQLDPIPHERVLPLT